MGETDDKTSRLVAAIADLEMVKAAATLDDSGNIERHAGQSKVLRSDATDETVDGDGSNHEDAYIESLAGGYLVVVFEARREFDPIKSEVDLLLEQFDF